MFCLDLAFTAAFNVCAQCLRLSDEELMQDEISRHTELGNELGDAGARTLAGAVPHAHVVELLLASNGAQLHESNPSPNPSPDPYASPDASRIPSPTLALAGIADQGASALGLLWPLT